MIHIIPIEPIETRYTKQWYEHLPKSLDNCNVIHGMEVPEKPTEGAFLDFAATNMYKSSQLIKVAEMFRDNKFKDGDHILITDAWNPIVIQIKYMVDLLGVNVKLHGLWHAGSYDPADFLGRLIKDKAWSYASERAMFECFDCNYFATQFHIKMFQETLGIKRNIKIKRTGWHVVHDVTPPAVLDHAKIYRTGWPMDYMPDTLNDYKDLEKRDLILFPHRISVEKQPEIFKDLAESMPQYEFVMCQEQELSKHEYHTLLGQAKLVFSANLQETLGISLYEGALVGAIPMAPDRLSYHEMYMENFLYPSVWTKDWNSYIAHKEMVMECINVYMGNYEKYRDTIRIQAIALDTNFFTATHLFEQLK